jgi:DNA-binding NarL/FixJ family response regulator
MMAPIKIIIADDHLMVREGIKQLLELEGDIKVIGEAKDGIECIDLIGKLDPEVVLLDINMPNMNGLQVLEHLKAIHNQTKILILTIHNEVEYLFRAVDIGVNGYVLKDSESSVLKTAIFEVYDGNTFIQPSIAPYLKEKYLSEKHPKLTDELLTKREFQVLILLAEGLYNKEIAYKLTISEKTVKNHVSSIFKKIGVSDRTQAAVYAIKNNFVEL